MWSGEESPGGVKVVAECEAASQRYEAVAVAVHCLLLSPSPPLYSRFDLSS